MVYDRRVTLDPTRRDVRRSADGPGPRWGRRVSLALLSVVVVAGAVGVLGVHSSTVSTRANGYLLSVSYARAARAGLDVPFTAHVQDTGGLPSSTTLAVSTDLLQQAVTQQDYSVTAAVLAVSTFCLLTVALSWLNARYRRVRPLTHGAALDVIDHGEPVLANLKAEQISIDDLMAAARSQGIERFADVRLAVLEANGRISFFTGHEESGASATPTVG